MKYLMSVLWFCWLAVSIFGAVGSFVGGVRFVREIYPFCSEPNSGLAQISLGIGIAVCIAATLFFSGLAALAIYVYQQGA